MVKASGTESRDGIKLSTFFSFLQSETSLSVHDLDTFKDLASVTLQRVSQFGCVGCPLRMRIWLAFAAGASENVTVFSLNPVSSTSIGVSVAGGAHCDSLTEEVSAWLLPWFFSKCFPGRRFETM